MKKKGCVIILLVCVLAVCLIAGIQYLKPDREEGMHSSFGIERFTIASREGEAALEPSSEQVDNKTYEERAFDESTFDENALADDVFILDDWVSQIDDFAHKVKEAADNQKESENIENPAEIAKEENIDSNFLQTAVPPVIIDTDFASDADDVVAVRLAMCFQDLGMLDIKGIALSTTYSRSPLALHALCRQDGYGDIPVAMDTSGNGVQVHTKYVDVMYEMPKSRDDYEQPVPMYRRILAASDTKVNIITLGFLQNIHGLMDSMPDQYSALTGMELIAQKVDTIYIVGGNSTGKPSFNFYWTGEKVISAARETANRFPARIVFLQTDLSDDTFCGQFYYMKDSHQRDIVTRALNANDQSGGIVAWDVFSVWCAVRDMNHSLEQSCLALECGNQYVSNTGATKWTASDTGRHYKMYKYMKGEYYSELMNRMLLQKYNDTHLNAD